MTFASPMADVLSGGSLVMAVLAAIFAVWQPEINKALDAKVRDDPANRTEEKKLVRWVTWSRLVPLLVVTLLAEIILSVRSFSIVTHTFGCLRGSLKEAECAYDEAAGLLLLTESLLLILTVAMVVQLRALRAKASELRQ